MKLFDKLMEKKKKSGMKMSDNECKAKTNVVQSLKDFASEAMGKDLGGLKKVTVASDSEEGLKKGLKKAEEMADGHEMDESPEHEMAESDSEASMEDEGEESSDESLAALEEIPVEKIDEAIQKLLDLKKQSKV